MHLPTPSQVIYFFGSGGQVSRVFDPRTPLLSGTLAFHVMLTNCSVTSLSGMWGTCHSARLPPGTCDCAIYSQMKWEIWPAV